MDTDNGLRGNWITKEFHAFNLKFEKKNLRFFKILMAVCSPSNIFSRLVLLKRILLLLKRILLLLTRILLLLKRILLVLWRNIAFDKEILPNKSSINGLKIQSLM